MGVNWVGYAAVSDALAGLPLTRHSLVSGNPEFPTGQMGLGLAGPVIGSANSTSGQHPDYEQGPESQGTRAHRRGGPPKVGFVIAVAVLGDTHHIHPRRK